MSLRWVSEEELKEGSDGPIALTATQLRDAFMTANMTIKQAMIFCESLGVDLMMGFVDKEAED